MHNVRVTLQNVLGIVASILSMLFIWPQVILVYRNKTVEGLSPIGALRDALREIGEDPGE